MGPDKDMSSNSFIVRVSFGSFLLAALITIVGLTWIFALGFIVGRMYPAENKEIQHISTQDPAPHMAEAQKPMPIESKKYHAVIRDDFFDEQANNKQGTQEHNASPAPRLATVKSTPQTPSPQQDNNVKVAQDTVISEEKPENESKVSTSTVAQTADAQTESSPEKSPAQAIKEPQLTKTAQAPSAHKQSAPPIPEDKAKTVTEEKEAKQEAPLFSYTYQIASIPDLEKAQELQSTLQKGGVQTFFEEHQAGTQTWHRLLMRFESHESEIPAFKENLQKFGINSVLLRSKKNIQ